MMMGWDCAWDNLRHVVRWWRDDDRVVKVSRIDVLTAVTSPWPGSREGSLFVIIVKPGRASCGWPPVSWRQITADCSNCCRMLSASSTFERESVRQFHDVISRWSGLYVFCNGVAW